MTPNPPLADRRGVSPSPRTATDTVTDTTTPPTSRTPDRTLRPDRDRAALAGALGRARPVRDGPDGRLAAQVLPARRCTRIRRATCTSATGTSSRRRDALARYRRMHGYNVFFPIGFDAFGLPAENAAIKSGGHPFTWTMPNIENMRRQFRTMGAMFAWEHRGRHRRPRPTTAGTSGCSCGSSRPAWPIARCRPSTGAPTTARWRASRSRAPTGTAGAAARRSRSATWSSGSCGRPTYADELLRFDGIDWPEPIRIQQTNWIGRSEGAEIDFVTAPDDHQPGGDRMRVFTTRPDTLFGATFMVLAPEHPLVERLTHPDRRAEVDRVRRRRRAGGPRSTACRPTARRPASRIGRRRDQPGQRRADPDLHRRLRAVRLRHRARSWPCPPTTSATSRSRSGSGCRSGGSSPRPTSTPTPRWTTAFIAHAAGERAGQQRPLRRPAGRRGRQGDRRRSWPRRGQRRAEGHVSPARLADQPPALLGHADPGHLLPDRRDRPGARRPAAGPAARDRRLQGQRRQPAEPRRGVRATSTCPTLRRAGPARDRHDGHVRGLVLVLVPLPVARTRTDGPVDREMVERWTPVDQYTGGAEHAVMHLLYARFFTKAMADIGLIDRARAVHPAVQPGPDPGRRRRADVASRAATSRTPTSWSRATARTPSACS